MKILLVDDNEELRDFLVQCLSEGSVEADTAGSSAEARQKTLATRYDAFVVDTFLGEEDGLALAMELAAAPKGGRGVPVLLMSNISTNLARRMATQAGCAEFLVKPFAPSQFVEAVKNLNRGSGRR